jgi:hypothetical protein
MALAEALQPDFDREAFLRAMVTEVVAHEVGHALGLRHNFKASTWRPAAELGDAAQTAKHGLVGSVMDYNPINLAAPGEPQGEFFASVPGPYDLWAIEYGYAEIEGSNVEGALAAIAARSPEPGLDFGTDEDLIVGDALCQVWDLGADPLDFAEQQIALAEAGLAKLREKGAKDGEGYHRYSRWYAMFARHYRRSYEDLGRFLGGWTLNRDLVGQEGGRPPIEPIDVVMQQRALDLLCDRGLAWTGGIPDADRLLLANPKFGPFGSWFGYWAMEQVTEAVNMARYWILLDLLDGGLYTRLGTQSRLAEGTGLDPHAVATRVFERVWSETPDEHDRWTQVDFVALVTGELGYDYPPDVRALFEILLDRCGERAATYTTAADPVIAAHGRSLGERIRRYRERQLVEF